MHGREDIGKAIGEVLSYLESENLTEHALEGIRERLADLEDKVRLALPLCMHQGHGAELWQSRSPMSRHLCL